ncbi:MAG TPA: GGDEF domain-containing protein [Actinomycetota bacterium]|nr:GGDEF domain-containing protein [Actinomycetota bacterium]
MSASGGMFSRIGYAKARFLLLGAGLGLLLLVAGVMSLRGVDKIEVGATLLFIPVFIALVLGGLKGGVGAGICAALAYTAFRYPAIKAVGFEQFAGLIASRSVGFLAFGTIGGWATKQLEASLTKLELYDQIDDATGLYNARFFAEDLDLEMSRSTRYQTLFSITLVDVPASAFAGMSRRAQRGLLTELGRLLRDSVRTVDRAAHAVDGDRYRFAVVLPETGNDGAEIFTNRLADNMGKYIREKVGAKEEGTPLYRRAATFPGDDEFVAELKAEFKEIDRREHPEAAAAG